jgi:hypothetical protein
MNNGKEIAYLAYEKENMELYSELPYSLRL